MTAAQTLVCFSGLFLFVLGLLNGIIVPRSKSPRLSLSAHLTAVQSGTFLVAIAWAWPHFGLSPTASALAAWGLTGSLYLLWIAFLLAGLWGAGRGLSIAGQGSEAGKAQQAIVTGALSLGVVGTMAATMTLLVMWGLLSS